MKFSEKWLREWVNPPLTTEELAHRLTMIGNEVDEIEPQGSALEGVIIATVLEVNKHPDADRLSVCQVSDGGKQPYTVVCGAPNVRAGLKGAFAPVGTKLPDGEKLRRAKIRGVESNGMLCSAAELGLGDESDGILELSGDAPPGESFSEYMDLPDYSFNVDLTPNRGDCFSVLGVARDVAAMTATDMHPLSVEAVSPTCQDEQPVELVAPEGCPRFVARVIRNVDVSINSPDWLKERLRRSGLRSISPVVDVTNYVMMELGQPLHAYDLSKIRGAIRPRMAKRGEKLKLLDEQEVELATNTLVIADDSGPIGMAGVMGGWSTMVSNDTSDVLLEAAFFTPEVMAGVARQYGMHTDASMRFERGVDPLNQATAIERATQLLVDICGGEPGPLKDHHDSKHLPAARTISLRKSRLQRVLGIDIPTDVVSGILANLGLHAELKDAVWDVQIPCFRFDIDVEDALVEEVARIFGYDEIPEATATGLIPLAAVTESRVDLDSVAEFLVARDYQEVITYSFVSEQLNTLISGETSELILSNPIASNMSVMRSSLWPGLLATASKNIARQHERVRIFEIGKTFHGSVDEPKEIVRVSGLIIGNAQSEQWGIKPQPVEFYDIKSDVEAILEMTGCAGAFNFVADEYPALQPGQTAMIERGSEAAGVIGKLHPLISKEFDIDKDVMLFDLVAESCFSAELPVANTISKFPVIRRDMAVIVKEDVSVSQLKDSVHDSAGELLREVRVFDLYRGSNIEPGRKSIALGLILQETSRTLTDEDADNVVSAVLLRLRQDFGAELRE